MSIGKVATSAAPAPRARCAVASSACAFMSTRPSRQLSSAKRTVSAWPMPPAAPVMRTALFLSPRMCASNRRALGEFGLPLLAEARDAFGRVARIPAHEFERQRGVEVGAHHAQPVVERVFREADRRARAVGELRRDLDALRLELVVGDAERDEADALGLLAGQRIA